MALLILITNMYHNNDLIRIITQEHIFKQESKCNTICFPLTKNADPKNKDKEFPHHGSL